MPLLPRQRLPRRQRLRHQSHPLIKLHMRPDLARLPDHHPRPVINEKMTPQLRPRVNVDPCPTVRPLRHHPRQQRHPRRIKQMRAPLNRDRLQPRIRQNNLLKTPRRRIPIKRRLHIRLQNPPHLRQLHQKLAHQLHRRLMQRLPLILQPQTPPHLRVQPLPNRRHQLIRHDPQFRRRHRHLRIKPRKQQMQQILAQRRNRRLRRQIPAIHMIDPPHCRVRGHQTFNDLRLLAIHNLPPP